MYKVLVFGMTDNYGGVEKVIMNYYHEFDNEKIHFDFICNTLNKMAYEDELVKDGAQVIHTVPKRKNIILYFKELNDFFKNNGFKYDCLWFNVNNLVNIDCLKLAKKYNFSKIIVHSHNSRIMEEGKKGKVKEIIHNYNRKKILKYATEYWACSKIAAKWMFPKEIYSHIKIIKNAIDIKNTSFNNLKRRKIREMYGLRQSFVIGNVGRLHFQKNQLYMLDLLKKALIDIPNAKLVLVGNGPDKEKIIQKIKQLNLSKNVILAGTQQDMQAWYSSFDLFLFPSVFEGLSVGLLEAQANGLPIISSDQVSPDEIKVNPNIEFISLDKNIDEWKEKIKEYSSLKRISYHEVQTNFLKSGYEIKNAAQVVEQMFLNSK